MNVLDEWKAERQDEWMNVLDEWKAEREGIIKKGERQ